MAQGNYDHAAYLARQTVKFVNVAGTAAVSDTAVMPWPIHIHSMNAVVRTAGTAAGAKMQLMAGTATAGVVTVGTSTAGTVVQSATDLNFLVPASTVIGLEGLGDATVVVSVVMEYNITPTATWLGTE